MLGVHGHVGFASYGNRLDLMTNRALIRYLTDDHCVISIHYRPLSAKFTKEPARFAKSDFLPNSIESSQCSFSTLFGREYFFAIT